MKKAIFTLLFFSVSGLFAQAQNVVITEIMYNNPGAEDYEFIELRNNGSTTVNLENWKISKGALFTFPSTTVAAGGFVVIAKNSALFEAAFGVPALQWNNNEALNNGGETIAISDPSNVVVDSVAYSPSAPWPTNAAGQGPSIVLCNYTSNNNDPVNWAAATTGTGFSIGGTEVFANPGANSQCPTGPVVSILTPNLNFIENIGTVFIQVAISGGNASPTVVTLQAAAASTASPGFDHNLTSPVTVTFLANVAAETKEVMVNLVDDGMIESTESLIVEISNASNGATVTDDNVVFTIIDNDSPLSSALVITGVYDADPGAAGAKGIELQATSDIPDLSIYGVSSANNGTGPSPTVETLLPAVALAEGECFYVADDSTKFFDFFGFYPGKTGGSMNINGDDAIELYENSIVIDVFGDVNADGSGTPWDYLDGWAYRVSGTGPDGSAFALANWTFSGVGALLDVPNNASAPNPFPTCTYSLIPPITANATNDFANTDINFAVTVDVLNNDILPVPLTSMIISVPPNSGTAVANGLDDITYTPDQDFCGTDVFKYKICDTGGCDEAIVTVTVNCPSNYPAYPISVVTTVDASGSPDSLGVTCELQGIVHGIDLQGTTDAIQFALIDQSGGISVFSANSFGYTVTEGDEIIVRGKISQFNCLTQITPDTVFFLSADNQLVMPEITAFLAEEFESELIRVNNLSLVTPSEWLGNGSSFNVNVTNGGSNYLMRIDNDCELSTMPAPVSPFHATGICGQFDALSPCDVGYQFLPRYAPDIIPGLPSKETLLLEKITVYPNPANERLYFNTAIIIDEVTVSNLLGQQLLSVKIPGNSLEISRLDAGMYLLTFQSGEASYTTRFLKK